MLSPAPQARTEVAMVQEPLLEAPGTLAERPDSHNHEGAGGHDGQNDTDDSEGKGEPAQAQVDPTFAPLNFWFAQELLRPSDSTLAKIENKACKNRGFD